MATDTTRKITGKHYDKGGWVKNACHPDYGADPTGVADSTAALQALLADMLLKGDVAVIPPGDYKVTAPLIPSGSNAFYNSSKHLISGYGARLFSYDATAGRDVFQIDAQINTEGGLTIEGLTIDGAHATATTNGVAIHTGNVKLERCVIRNFTGGYGVRYVYDVITSLPPICSEIASCYIQNNRIGVFCDAPASGLAIHGGRIEHNKEENIRFDNCGQFSLGGSLVVEASGDGGGMSAKPNFYCRNAVNGSIVGCYFESSPYQEHSSIVFEGVTTIPKAIVFLGNRVTGYYCDAAGAPLLNSIGLDVAPGTGAVDAVVAFGNEYFGQTTAVRIGTNCRGSTFGPDDFADALGGGTAWSGATTYAIGDIVSSGGSSYVCILAHTNHVPPNGTYWTAITLTRYNIVNLAQPNIVYDVNRFAAMIYNAAAINLSGLLTAASGIKVTGGSSSAGTITKDTVLGLLLRAVAGSTADAALVNSAGAAIWEVPAGTLVSQFFGSVQHKTATIAYSVSMTPDAAAGNVQTITATNGTAFAINAPTSPRAGERLSFITRNASGGALGAITPNAVFKLAGSAWPTPANGFSRSLDVQYDGTNWVELSRGATDVPN